MIIAGGIATFWRDLVIETYFYHQIIGKIGWYGFSRVQERIN